MTASNVSFDVWNSTLTADCPTRDSVGVLTVQDASLTRNMQSPLKTSIR
eukprot:CAMPEP_0174867618 /NCGR_PEP_ID=MMETSP1114-20130205/64378_1 /TAXON_ID=312471 /ORGANISM="Neobodo designis, Strain CCAP 1951/1" /LENGTH=48 /DNA_ID= /DNA_START= /DNA_END= /DNA_ORIENTATION=